jgi:hypothetical protein
MLHPRSIISYALAFFDRYLKDASDDSLLGTQQAQAAAMVTQKVSGAAALPPL